MVVCKIFCSPFFSPRGKKNNPHRSKGAPPRLSNLPVSVLRKQPLQQLQWRLNSGWADLDGSNQENGVCLPLLAVRRACEDDGAFFLADAVQVSFWHCTHLATSACFYSKPIEPVLEEFEVIIMDDDTSAYRRLVQ